MEDDARAVTADTSERTEAELSWRPLETQRDEHRKLLQLIYKKTATTQRLVAEIRVFAGVFSSATLIWFA